MKNQKGRNSLLKRAEAIFRHVPARRPARRCPQRGWEPCSDSSGCRHGDRKNRIGRRTGRQARRLPIGPVSYTHLILPTIVTMFIMRCGQIMSVGHEKIILLMTPSTQEAADVISTFVYRMVFANPNPQYSFSAAVGLFNSVVNFALVIIANTVSKKLSNTSLW